MQPLNNKGINEMNELDCLRAIVARPSTGSSTGPTTNPVSVAQGGTGATTPSAARVNLGMQFNVKALDQTIVSDTNFNDITDLSFNVVAGETWYFKFEVFAVAESTAPGIILRMVTTGEVSSYRDQVEYSAGGGPNMSNGAQHIESDAQISRNVYAFPGVATDPQFVRITGALVCSTSGVVKLQFSQVSSSVDDLTIRSKSSVNAWKV